MNDPAIENEVIRRWQEQTPMRRIAVELRISRYLVKRIIMDHQAGRAQGATHPDLPTPPESRGSILDQHVPFIQDLLARWPSMTALRIHEELRGRGFTGKYTIVKDLVRRLRPEPRRQPVLRFETSKGAQAQMDYATYEIDFTRGGAAAGQPVRLHPGLLAAAVPALHGVAGLRDHDPRARAGLHAPGRRCRHLPVRQHEGRGGPLRGRRADLQHPLPGLRHALRIQGMGVQAQPSSDEGQVRAAIQIL